MLKAFLCLSWAFATSHAIAAVPPIPKPVSPKPVSPNIPDIHPIGIPEPRPAVPPRPVPNPATPKNPSVPKLPNVPDHPIPRLPIVKNDGDDGSVFDLGHYEENEPALFQNFDGRSKPLFSVMYNFFEVKETYLPKTNAYADATGKENPFDSGRRPTGQPLRLSQTITSPTERVVTATFDPRKPLDACRAWATLATYCADGGQACACYSGTYYVPDQWNSLAAGCAAVTSKCPKESGSSEDAWCQIGRTAANQTSYCTTSFTGSQSPSIVKFAEKANKIPASTSATLTSGATTSTTLPIGRATGIASGTARSFSSSPATSWSSPILNPATVNRYSWIILSVSLFYYM